MESEFSPTVSDESEQRLLSATESASQQGTNGSAAQPSGDKSTDERKDQSEYEKAQREARRYREDMERSKREGTYT